MNAKINFCECVLSGRTKQTANSSNSKQRKGGKPLGKGVIGAWTRRKTRKQSSGKHSDERRQGYKSL